MSRVSSATANSRSSDQPLGLLMSIFQSRTAEFDSQSVSRRVSIQCGIFWPVACCWDLLAAWAWKSCGWMKPTVCWETYDRHDDDNVLHVKRMSNCHAQSLVFDPTCQCGRVLFLSRLAVLWSSIRSANRWTAKCQPHSTSTDRLRFVLLFFYLPPTQVVFLFFSGQSFIFIVLYLVARRDGCWHVQGVQSTTGSLSFWTLFSHHRLFVLACRSRRGSAYPVAWLIVTLLSHLLIFSSSAF